MILLYLFKIGHVLHDCYDKLVGKYYSIKISAFTEVKDSVKVEGRMFFYKAKGAYVQIGKQLRIINSAKVNSLCTRISSIRVFGGAELKIGNNVGMSSITICASNSICIGDNVNFGAGCMLFDTHFHRLYYKDRRSFESDSKNALSRKIVIDDDVFIGANSLILKGVHIGARSIVGAGSVVTKDVPSDTIVAGNPAKIIKTKL